jgi:Na+/melibiose symporter-like transporter
MAFIADVTREQVRTKSMAIVGGMVGLSFLGAMMIAPVLDNKIGLRGLFYVTAILGIIAIFVLLIEFSSLPKRLNLVASSLRSNLSQALFLPELWRLNIGIYVLHAILTALFVILPLLLQ